MINRIKLVKEHYGLSTRGLAVKCGLNQPTLDRMLEGINALNLNCVSSILLAFPEISAEWLMRGSGQMLIQKENNTAEMERINSLVDTIATLQDMLNSKNDIIAQR